MLNLAQVAPTLALALAWSYLCSQEENAARQAEEEAAASIAKAKLDAAAKKVEESQIAAEVERQVRVALRSAH